MNAFTTVHPILPCTLRGQFQCIQDHLWLPKMNEGVNGTDNMNPQVPVQGETGSGISVENFRLLRMFCKFLLMD